MGNVGEAVLAIIGDSKPFERTLNNLDKTVGRSADRIGESIGSRLGAATGRALRIGITAAAAGAAVAAGAALSKGFQRFADIEDATAALTITLGDAGKAAEFLGEVLEVVEGTPFSLDQFATVAKNLVAMQIEAGKVPGILRAIGEAGAATGKGAEGVNTVADAIGRMATGAKLSLEPIRALEDQGIPALTILANKFGVTTSRMAKDISSGAIDSSKAIDLLTDGILRGTTGVSGLSVEAEKAAENLEGLGESAVTAEERLTDLRDNVSDVQQRMGDLARDAGDAREALEDALRPASAREMESAILSVERSLNRQADAAKDLEDAQQDLNEAMRDTQRIADEIARGALDERRARLSVEEAIDRVQDAEKELAEARKTGNAEKISDAERDLESSRLSVEESQLRLNEAERDAKEIREDAPKQADKIAQAEKRVRDAQIAQRESALGVAEAQESLNELRRKGSEQDEKVIAARRRIVDVTRQQVDAEKDLAKAQKEVIKGEKEVVEAHKKVSDAQKEVDALGSETNKNTVALAGSMDALGETTRGAMANLVTAVARAAARVFTAFSKAGGDTNVLAGIMTNLRDTVDIVGKRFGAVAEDIAGSKGFGKVLAFFEGLPEKVDKALGDLEGKTLSEAFTSMVDKIDFGSLASKVIDGFFAALRKVPITKFSGVFTEIVLETLATSAASIVEGVIRIAPKIAVGVVAGFLRAFADNPISTTAFIGALGLPVIGPAIIGFMSKLPFGGLVAPLFKGLGRAVSAGFGVLSRTTLGTAVGVFGLTLQEKLTSVLTAAGTAVSGVATTVGNAIGAAVSAAISAAQVVGRAVVAVGSAIGSALVTAGAAAASVASTVGTAIGTAMNVALAAASAVASAISATVSAALTAAGAVASAVATAVGTAIGVALNAAIAAAQAVRAAVIAISVAVGGLLTSAAAAAAPVITAVGTAIGAGLDAAIGAGIVLGVPILVVAAGIALGVLLNRLIEKFVPGVNDFLEKVGAEIFDFITDKVPRFFAKTLPGVMFQVGKLIVGGLIRGVLSIIRSGIPWVGPAIADKIESELNKFLEIKSPSKLTERIGLQLGEGLIVGLSSSLQDAAVVARREMDRISAALVPTTDSAQFFASVRGSDGAAALTAARNTLSQTKDRAQVIIENLNVNEAVTTLATARMLANDLAKALVR